MLKRNVTISLLAISAHACLGQIDSTAVHEQQIDEVVVSARRNESVDATSPVQVLDDQRMMRLGIGSIAEALRHVAGITVRDYGGAGGMKTVSVRGIGSRHTAVDYDGIALSDCQTGEIDLSRYATDLLTGLSLQIMDADDLLQPARNAVAANTLFLNAMPTGGQESKDQMLNATLGIGSFGYVSPSVRYSAQLSERFRLSALGAYTYADNDYPFTLRNVELVTRERRQNSRMSTGHAELNACWMADPDNSLTAKVYYFDSNRRLPGIVHLYTNENDERLREQTAFGQMQWRSRLASRWQLLVSGKWNWSLTDYKNGMPTGGVTSARYVQREGYTSAVLSFEATDRLSLGYAADYIWNGIGGSLGNHRKPFRHTLLQVITAKYSTHRLTLIGKVAGGLYLNGAKQGEHGDNERQLSPSLSGSLRLLNAERLYLRASLKQVFRMPTFNELYFYHLGSTDLRPERTQQMNIGLAWTHRFARQLDLYLTADAYINKVNDKIVAIPFNMFVWRMMNLSSVRSHGFDFTADAQWQVCGGHTIGLTGNCSLQNVQNRTNSTSSHYKKQVAYTPQTTFCLTATWQNPWANLSLTTDGMSHRWATNEHAAGTRLAGFVEADASVWRTFSIGRNKLTAQFALLNIFDRQYDIVAHYPMPGRSWKLTLTFAL